MSTDADSGTTRREILQRAAALGLVVGGFGALEVGDAVAATPKPKRGGTLRVGLPGGPASTDNLDPHLEGVAGFAQAYRQIVYSKLTDMRPDGSFVNQLAESLTPNKDATAWTIKLRKGITFHDGSELTVDDVIYTFKRILDPANKLSAARGNIDMIDPSGMRKVSKYVMTVKLTRPWSDLPAAVGQRYISIVKGGAAGPFTAQNANGTGAFKLASWTPGDSYQFVANRNYFETGKPYLNGVTFVGIPDSVARVNALVSGQVDVISDVPGVQVGFLKSSGLRAIINPGGGWTPLVMNTNAAPYNDVRVRQAMKLLIDRKQSISVARQGYATIGNDLFAKSDPLYASAIPQRSYDPEKAQSLLKAAGQLDTQFVLRTAAAESDFVPLALAFAQGAKKAGVNVTIQQDPADTFWDNTWGVAPFTFSSWGYRSFFTQWLQSFVSYNAQETRWNDASQKKASRLVYKAAATGDPQKRKELAFAAQKLHWDDGGYIIPYFKQTIDGANTKVQGIEPHVFPALSWYRFWNFWLS
jgi:peptide/nickel transport system substrate-binding protein